MHTTSYYPEAWAWALLILFQYSYPIIREQENTYRCCSMWAAENRSAYKNSPLTQNSLKWRRGASVSTHTHTPTISGQGSQILTTLRHPTLTRKSQYSHANYILKKREKKGWVCVISAHSNQCGWVRWAYTLVKVLVCVLVDEQHHFWSLKLQKHPRNLTYNNLLCQIFLV